MIRSSGFDSSGHGDFLESLLGDRKKRFMDLCINGPAGAHGEEPAEEYVTGIIGEAVHGWINGSIGAVPDCPDNWGRRSFTIRIWFNFGEILLTPGGFHVQGGFRIPIFKSGFGPLLFDLIKDRIFLETGVIGDCDPGARQIVIANQLSFRLWNGNAIPTGLGQVVEQDTNSDDVACLLNENEAGTGGVVGDPTVITGDTWHRVVCWYDADTLEFGMQLDNRTPVTSTALGPIPTSGSQTNFMFHLDALGGNPFDVAYDETGLWHDYVWTEAERLADWADGAGTGWPDVLSIISKRPFAYFRFEPEDEYPATQIIDGFFGPNNFPRIIANKATPQFVD